MGAFALHPNDGVICWPHRPDLYSGLCLVAQSYVGENHIQLLIGVNDTLGFGQGAGGQRVITSMFENGEVERKKFDTVNTR